MGEGANDDNALTILPFLNTTNLRYPLTLPSKLSWNLAISNQCKDRRCYPGEKSDIDDIFLEYCNQALDCNWEKLSCFLTLFRYQIHASSKRQRTYFVLVCQSIKRCTTAWSYSLPPKFMQSGKNPRGVQCIPRGMLQYTGLRNWLWGPCSTCKPLYLLLCWCRQNCAFMNVTWEFQELPSE